ncbi:MAG: ATP-binding protein [Sulfuricurvum sp.]
MQELKLGNFKAHKELDINFDNKNFLLYGDNGAGKSSIYEALKLIFYREKIESKIKSRFIEEEQEEKIKEFYREYNNKVTNDDFTLTLNSDQWDSFNKESYSVYMLTLDDLVFDKVLKLDELLKTVYFDLPTSIQSHYENIITKANTHLGSFLEIITLELDAEDNSIKIADTNRNLNTKEIKKYFNEAKLNLVILALIFSAIEVCKEESKTNILILDDFITSLDMANRTFLMKYILATFKDFQILIFTHNVYFYNLIISLLRDKICDTSKDWQYVNIYEINDKHSLFSSGNDKVLEDIEAEINSGSLSETKITCIGNQLRQKFEQILYEFSKIIMIGGVEESNKILNAILNDKMYINFQGGDCCDLIREIESLISIDTNDGYLKTKVNSQINKYKVIGMDQIKEVLVTLKLYRKVSMHSLSHGGTGQHGIQPKEIKQTLALLKNLETNIKGLINANTDGS